MLQASHLIDRKPGDKRQISKTFHLGYISALFLQRYSMKMLCFLFSALLVAVPAFAAKCESHGDAYIHNSVVQSLRELEAQKAQEADDPVVQRATSVCYEELGCFDKDGTFKHLKQLPEPPETVNTQFLLFTRKNPADPQMLDYKRPDTILKSNLDPFKPLKMITHGFGGRNNLTWVRQMKEALLLMHDINIIVVDWSIGAREPYYIQAAVNSELVGAEAAVMYFFIKDNLDIQEKDLHLIGFSLGAQVVGFVGKRMMELRGTRPARITGLDPASPLFEDYGGEVHLYKDDADLVDVVHTNADLLMYGGVGMGIPIGHVDFYPNGGKRQPGCKTTIKGALVDIFKGEREKACNHERSVHLYTDTILNPDGCVYVGYQCVNYTEFMGARCMDCTKDCGRMGYDVQGNGTYYFMTREKQPFCSDHAKVSVHFPKDVKKSYGAIILTLVGANDAKENVTLTVKDEKLLPGSNRSVAIILGDGMKPLKGVDALYVRFNGWITKGTMTYGLSSVAIEDAHGNYLFKTCGEEVILNDNEYQPLPSSC